MQQEDTPSLYIHKKHPHQAINVNALHQAEIRDSFNTRLGVFLTHHIGSMWAAYTFFLLAVCGLLAILGILTPLIATLVAWTSQTLIQLCMLPIIVVGQNVQGRKSELQADEAYQYTQRTYHDTEQLRRHMDCQDRELLRQSQLLQEILAALEEKKPMRRRAGGEA